MTRAEKMALAYGASLGGAALVSYLRGRRGFAEIELASGFVGVYEYKCLSSVFRFAALEGGCAG